MKKESELKAAINRCAEAFEAYRRSKNYQFASDLIKQDGASQKLKRVSFEHDGKKYSILEWR